MSLPSFLRRLCGDTPRMSAAGGQVAPPIVPTDAPPTVEELQRSAEAMQAILNAPDAPDAVFDTNLRGSYVLSCEVARRLIEDDIRAETEAPHARDEVVAIRLRPDDIYRLLAHDGTQRSLALNGHLITRLANALPSERLL